jgi:hypothetical protein
VIRIDPRNLLDLKHNINPQTNINSIGNRQWNVL